MRYILLSCLWTGLLSTCATSVAWSQESMSNPVVAGATLGEFQHGAYPSHGFRTHPGSNLVASCGTDVYPLADGTVVDRIGDVGDPDFNTIGYMIIVEHPAALRGEQFYSAYFHLDEPPAVVEGMEVKAGRTLLGKVGNTGIAYECLVHVEVRYFAERFQQGWQTPYGAGDKREDETFLSNWDDPLEFFLVYPDGLRGRMEATNSSPVEQAEEPVYTFVDSMPQIIGGLGSLQKDVEYPRQAVSRRIEGRVFVQFIVTKEGTVEDAEVLRGIGYGCDEAALVAVENARFKPGEHNGEVVAVKMSVPVTFKIQ